MRSRKRALAVLLASSSLVAFSFVIAQASPQAVEEAQLTEAEQALFIKGQTLHGQGLYSEAVVVLKQFLDQYPHSLIKDLGLLWLGRCYLAQADLANAEQIELRLKTLPDTAMLGIYEEELRIGRQNYARSVAASRTGLETRVNQPAAVSMPEADQALVPATGKAVAIRPAIPEQKAVAPIAGAGSIPRAPASGKPTDVKGTGASGLFLPSSLEIPIARGAENVKGLTASTDSLPRPDKAVAAAKPAARQVSMNGASTVNQPLVEKPATTSLSAQRLSVSPKLMNEPARDPGTLVSKVEVPLLRLQIEETTGVSAADGAVSYRLIIVNEGRGAAKDLTVRGEFDGALDYVTSNPMPVRQELVAQKQVLTFRLPLVQPGETKVLQISVRSRRAGTLNLATQTKHSIFYRDSKGNFLHTP
ncbi:MAG: hypothetical protein JWM21_1085 [Acidobacteria bacterium]|nr:hypothetical protein [Acidobacteriota bacterium]